MRFEVQLAAIFTRFFGNGKNDRKGKRGSPKNASKGKNEGFYHGFPELSRVKLEPPEIKHMKTV
jgi:hypothetical protein